MRECKYKKFKTTAEMVDYINKNKIERNEIVTIMYNRDIIRYILIYFS